MCTPESGYCHSVRTPWDMAKGLGEEKGERGIRNYGKRVGGEEEGEGGRKLGKAELNLAFPRRPGSFSRFMFINFDFLSFLLSHFPLTFFQLFRNNREDYCCPFLDFHSVLMFPLSLNYLFK
jgi:hypothetical protein